MVSFNSWGKGLRKILPIYNVRANGFPTAVKKKVKDLVFLKKPNKNGKGRSFYWLVCRFGEQGKLFKLMLM